MKYIFINIFIICSMIWIFGCEDKPTDVDRQAKVRFIVIDTSGAVEIDPETNLRLLKNAEVSFISQDYNKTFKFYTDNKGIVMASNIVSSHYTIAVNKEISDAFMVYGSKEQDIFGQSNVTDTIYVKTIPTPGIIINEIYYSGPLTSSLYYSDQFIELYNNSEKTLYLDGFIICRTSKETGDPSSITTLADGRVVVKVINAYQFPGTPGGSQYPLESGKFAVVAMTAIDHRKAVASSVDLSNADWEFFNPNTGSVDNPKIKNVVNIIPSVSTNFMIALSSDAIIMASGKKPLITIGTKYYIDYTSVVDGVEYLSGASISRKLDGRIDAGYAGIGVPRYGGKSIERLANPTNPKKHFDTNNSTVDFGIDDKPTPGYQGNPVK